MEKLVICEFRDICGYKDCEHCYEHEEDEYCKSKCTVVGDQFAICQPVRKFKLNKLTEAKNCNGSNL